MQKRHLQSAANRFHKPLTVKIAQGLWITGVVLSLAMALIIPILNEFIHVNDNYFE